MKSKFWFILLALCIVAIIGLASIFHVPDYPWIYVAYAMAILSLIMLFRSIIKPHDTVIRGMELISAQDFNNRLTPVGEYNADKIVTLFNSLIDKLRLERLRNLEQDSFLRLLIDSSPMGVMMLDFDGKIVMINNSLCRITGIKGEQDALGRYPEDLPTDLAAKISAVPLGESRIIRRGDIRRYRCYHLSFMQSGFKRRFFLLESLTEEMMKTERAAYEKVIRTMSHEVNNTMGGVKSVLELLHDTADDDELSEVIESCDDRCDRLCEFISSYAQVVKVPAPVRQDADLNDTLSAMLPFLKGMIPETVSLDYSPGDISRKVSIDISLIQQVVVNIVKNAVESITGDGHIIISTGILDNSVWLDISNDGMPITDEVSHMLFSPFFTTKRDGRGLGLTLISEILNRHNAQFSLKTDTDGITHFHIEFE